MGDITKISCHNIRIMRVLIVIIDIITISFNKRININFNAPGSNRVVSRLTLTETEYFNNTISHHFTHIVTFYLLIFIGKFWK